MVRGTSFRTFFREIRLNFKYSKDSWRFTAQGAERGDQSMENHGEETSKVRGFSLNWLSRIHGKGRPRTETSGMGMKGSIR